MKEKFFGELKEKIQPYFEENGGHSFDHTQRVYNMCLILADGEENIDLDILKAAAMLHDVARLKQDMKEVVCHAESGAEMAKEILSEMNFPQEKIGKIVNAVAVHRYSKNLKAETKEAEILQDADRLDALGAMTIARIFSYGGKRNRPLYIPEEEIQEYKHNTESQSCIGHFHEKILKLNPEGFHTKKAQEIAKARYDFVKDFVNRFIKEWGGEI